MEDDRTSDRQAPLPGAIAARGPRRFDSSVAPSTNSGPGRSMAIVLAILLRHLGGHGIWIATRRFNWGNEAVAWAFGKHLKALTST